MNTPGTVALGWGALFVAGMTGLIVGRQPYGEKKERMLQQQERDTKSFDQKMKDWETEAKVTDKVKSNLNKQAMNKPVNSFIPTNSNQKEE